MFKTISESNEELRAKKVQLEEEDGWCIVRENVKSTRMAKPKPADEQLEDEVWSILVQMGFKEMSKGRQFTIAVEKDLPPRQIDVFAKDDESVVIVECTQRDAPGKKSMASLIEKIRAIRESVLKSIHKVYGQQTKLKVKFVIATRKISWSSVDIDKCKEAQIAVITDGELDYYAALVQHLRHASRYQFLGHMFEGQKIDGLVRQVVAARGKMGGHTFYSFLIEPDELLKIAYVGHKAGRDIDNLKTYQRMLQPRRLKKIAEYINGGGQFPTNIVVNLKTNRRSGLEFETKEKFGKKALGVLHLPPIYASAWIIDGQHRLYGYAYARDAGGFNQDSTVLPVLAYENLPAEEEMNLFIDINSKQVKVKTGLLVELYSDLHWKSTNPEEAFQALLSRIASQLNSDPDSPLYSRMVVTGKKKTNYRCLTQTSIRDGLSVAGLLGTFNRGTIVPGPLSTARADAYDANLKKGLSVISNCLGIFSAKMPTHWETGDGPNGYLCTNSGLQALFHVIQDISNYIKHRNGVDLYLLGAVETFKNIEPYLQALADFFENASGQEIQAFRRIGSSRSAFRQQAYGMEMHIQKKFENFKTAGLQKYLEELDEKGTEEAQKKVRRIQTRLFDYVIGTLKKQYGTQDHAWWVQGVPVKIRTDCSARWEEKSREGSVEKQLFLINYVDICINNWDIVKDVISLDAKDKQAKTVNIKWIKRLNEIRNKVFHPEQGALSTEQVAFVEDIYKKVEEHFPEGDA
ncbi:MAG: DGQHR domain-containing protein [Gammaproteobacteria bacterium]|nr:DGQHR domain-containing protein [Gammaproteobacteria bacterium]MDE0611147.1 DGQHR domain-containing protein [Gammaproteobacteria bacterium]